jgi:hypothetical protein
MNLGIRRQYLSSVAKKAVDEDKFVFSLEKVIENAEKIVSKRMIIQFFFNLALHF